MNRMPSAELKQRALARGAAHIDRRDYDAAVADFTAIIKLDAYNADAYYGRGLAHHRKGSLDAAVADYDRAVEIVPPTTKAFGARGAAKLAQGKMADAIADFDEAVKADPKDAVNYEGSVTPTPARATRDRRATLGTRPSPSRPTRSPSQGSVVDVHWVRW